MTFWYRPCIAHRFFIRKVEGKLPHHGDDNLVPSWEDSMYTKQTFLQSVYQELKRSERQCIAFKSWSQSFRLFTNLKYSLTLISSERCYCRLETKGWIPAVRFSAHVYFFHLTSNSADVYMCMCIYWYFVLWNAAFFRMACFDPQSHCEITWNKPTNTENGLRFRRQQSQVTK